MVGTLFIIIFIFLVFVLSWRFTRKEKYIFTDRHGEKYKIYSVDELLNVIKSTEEIIHRITRKPDGSIIVNFDYITNMNHFPIDPADNISMESIPNYGKRENVDYNIQSIDYFIEYLNNSTANAKIVMDMSNYHIPPNTFCSIEIVD